MYIKATQIRFCRDVFRSSTSNEMMSGYSLLTLSVILILGRQGFAELLDKGCRPIYIPMAINGADAGPAPYMAYITVNRIYTCGGSLISNRFVLSAQHCAILNGKYSVRLGEHDTSKKEQEEEIRVISIIRHSEIDIALFKLEREVVYKANIRPICIFVDPEAASRLGNVIELTLTGWGQISYQAPTLRPTKLQQVVLSRIDPYSCGNQYGYICAHNPKQFACKGDSGGPLGADVKHNGETVYAQVGVLHGAEDERCNSYSKYADVVLLTEWIVNKIRIYK